MENYFSNGTQFVQLSTPSYEMMSRCSVLKGTILESPFFLHVVHNCCNEYFCQIKEINLPDISDYDSVFTVISALPCAVLS